MSCYLCDDGDAAVTPRQGARVSRVHCGRCGKYCIEIDAIVELKDVEDHLHLLSGLTRQHASRYGTEFVLCAGQIKKLIATAPTRVDEKIESLVARLAERSPYPGASIPLQPIMDYPLAYCRSQDELRYFTRYLESQKLIAHGAHSSNSQVTCTLTVEGWSFFYQHSKIGSRSDKAFVAMSFDRSMDEAWAEGIAPAVISTGWVPDRIDKHRHNNDITDEIFAHIQECKFVIAEFSGHRNGVYFEAGYARGLGKPVIWLCSAADFKGLHFDTRQFNHVKWDDVTALREELEIQIRATIGRGPHSELRT